MARVFLLRHGATPWNEQRRIQGQADIGLASDTIASLRQQRIPAGWLDLPWFTSPQLRCRQTACLLGAADAAPAGALREMHWGEFEGLTLDRVNAEIERLGLRPGRGLDLLPPGGESPRMVRDRLRRWLLDLPEETGDLVAVTHKGVIRAALSLATGWDMMTPFPRPVRWQLLHRFELGPGGAFHLDRLNCRWREAPR